MIDILRVALNESGRGYSPDRVVADPELNLAFIAACRNHGLTASDADLNRALLNLRKHGGLKDRKSIRSTFDDSNYRFAAEIAVRFLERSKGTTLDQIICDPELGRELVEVARQISPGYSDLQYKWAALALRKTRKLSPELVAQVSPPIAVHRFTTAGLDTSALPIDQGLYLFHTSGETLYIGESENLRRRIEKHLDHSDNRDLARWFWEFPREKVHLELQVLANTTSNKVRRALEMELIRSRNPLFNVKR